jgi:hypothetical protein
MPTGPGEISTLVCCASVQHPRHSEAAILGFDDGRLLLAYTDFYGANWRDEGPARICGKWSQDEGATWSEPLVLQENIGRLNCMSASLLRLPSGRIMLAFGRKDAQPGLLEAVVRSSDDEGWTWSVPVAITRGERYWCITNDRLVRLSSGRILYPLEADGVGCHCWFSDDGTDWRMSSQPVQAPPGVEYAEPTVVELPAGGVAMYIRTTAGNIHVALSDDGDRWRMHKSHPPDMCGHPDSGPNAAYSPCMVKRVPGTEDLLLVWNNNRLRTPLTAAVSHDGGESWHHLRNLEEMDGWPPRLTHAYPSVEFLRGNVHLTYWEAHTHPAAERFIHLRYRRLPISWFYEKP